TRTTASPPLVTRSVTLKPGTATTTAHTSSGMRQRSPKPTAPTEAQRKGRPARVGLLRMYAPGRDDGVMGRGAGRDRLPGRCYRALFGRLKRGMRGAASNGR